MPEMAVDLNSVLAVFSILFFVGLVGWFAYLVRHQEQVEPEREVYGVELLEQHYAPGATIEQPTPYFVSPIPASPDPLEISANLDKKIVLGALMLFGLFGMTGLYFVIQGDASPFGPRGIRAAAVGHQLRLDVRRGKAIYASLCYDCHGRDGKAGANPDGEILPGLPLNKPEFKHDNIAADPARVASVRRLIETTVERGRHRPEPAYSMPAWSRDEGGPLSEWQIKQLADLIMYGTEEDWADVVHVRTEHDQPVAEQIPPPPPIPSGDVVAANVCSVCHSFQQDRPSTNPAAPSLWNYGAVGPINAELKALKDSGDPEWLHKWVANAPSVKPGTAMPAYGGQLGDDGVRLVVEYLLKLGK